MENHKNFHHDDLLERAVDAVRGTPISDRLPPDQIDQLVETLQQAADQPYSFTMIERARNMKSRFAIKIVVATAIVIAFFGLISWLAPNGTTPMAFADVVEALNRIKTATWKSTQVHKGYSQDEPEKTTTIVGMFMAPSYERLEYTTKGYMFIDIFDGEKGEVIRFIPKEKRAVTTIIKGRPGECTLGKTLSDLRTMVINAKDGKNNMVERLGTKTLDGRRAEVFCFRKGNPTMKYQSETKIWADPKTSLPIRVERSFRENKREFHSVMTDFQIDVKLDPSLFSKEVPKGYNEMQKIELDISNGPFTVLAEVLGMDAEINGGVFPDSLYGHDGLDEIEKRVFKQLAEKYPNDHLKRYQKGTEFCTKLPVAMAALDGVKQHGDWHYTGKGVKLNVPNQAILRCNFGEKYRVVIYADLSVDQVLPEESRNKRPFKNGKNTRNSKK